MSGEKPNKDKSDINIPLKNGWIGEIKNIGLNSSAINNPGGYPLNTLRAGIR